MTKIAEGSVVSYKDALGVRTGRVTGNTQKRAGVVFSWLVEVEPHPLVPNTTFLFWSHMYPERMKDVEAA